MSAPTINEYTVSGVVDVASLNELFDFRQRSECEGRYGWLIEFASCDFRLTGDELAYLFDGLRSYRIRVGTLDKNAYAALVVDSPFAFAVTRMLKAYAQHANVFIEVFDTWEEGRTYVQDALERAA